MDWAKSKTIIILALIAANLFLLLTFVVMKSEHKADEALVLQQTLELLEEKQIFVDTEIPVKHNAMPVLDVKYDRLRSGRLHEVMDAQIPLEENKRNKEGILNMAEAFLIDCGVWSENVVLESYLESGEETIIRYANVYEGLLIEDSYLVLTVQDGVVTEVDRHWLTPLEFGRTKRATMSASAALVSFMGDPQRPETIHITNVQLVYWIDSVAYGGETTISDTAFPAWKITYNDGEVKHVPAYIE